MISTIDRDMEYVTSVPGGDHILIMYDDVDIIDMLPVLAFLIYRSPTLDGKAWVMSMFPVTSDGLHWDSADEWALLRPDGKVDLPFDRVLPNMEAFQVERETRARQRAAAKAAKEAKATVQ